MKTALFNMLIICAFALPSFAQYTMPFEGEEHEGTWLQWPHNFTYPPYNRDDLEDTWVEMTRELIKGENVHIIAYNNNEKDYITQLLTDNGVSLAKVDFLIKPNDDVWVRDNGPIFVYDQNNELRILDWSFNGWGGDAPYQLCNTVPGAVAADLSMPVTDLNTVVLEGGAFEIDGNGTLMATRSSILQSDRNPNWTEAQIETFMTDNLGVTNIIWLEGVHGLEITDMHIDGFARFHNSDTIVTMNNADLTYWQVPADDIDTLMNAVNANGQSYDHVILPLTQNNVITTWGQNLGYKGSYVNYYVANAVVLVPDYNDPNDAVAISILEDIYPNKEVVGIDVRNLYLSGGMIHCVTQQQPVALAVLPLEIISFTARGEDCRVILEWETADGTPPEKFIIERSSSNQNWEKIGEVFPKFNHPKAAKFRFTDSDPLADNYYRLQQLDFDGTRQFSQIVTARNQCSSGNKATVFPNVIQDRSTLKIEGEITGILTIQIFTESGKIVQTINTVKVDEVMKIPLSVSDFAAGSYFVKINSADRQSLKTIKFIVTH